MPLVFDKDSSDTQSIKVAIEQLIRSQPELEAVIATIPIYVSRRCSYTMDMRRIYLCARKIDGHPLAICELQRILLHEIAHVLMSSPNSDNMHTEHFWKCYHSLLGPQLEMCDDPVHVPHCSQF